MAAGIKKSIGRGLSRAADAAPRRRPRFDVAGWKYFPIPQGDDRAEMDRLRRSPRKTFWCPVCGRRSLLRVGGVASLREIIACYHCHGINRHRQLAAVILGTNERYPDLTALGQSGSRLRVYGTEAHGPLHEALKPLPNYTFSEYKEGDYRSGQVVDGIVHQDLHRTSYKSNRFDLIFSSDVFEHMPDPYRGHREIFRILAPGGRHVMSVPFDATSPLDDVRAELTKTGKVKLLGPAEYHHDSLRPEGILMFRRFGLEMLVHAAEIGFDVNFYNLHDPRLGIFGKHAFIFELVKPRPARRKRRA